MDFPALRLFLRLLPPDLVASPFAEFFPDDRRPVDLANDDAFWIPVLALFAWFDEHVLDFGVNADGRPSALTDKFAAALRDAATEIPAEMVARPSRFVAGALLFAESKTRFVAFVARSCARPYVRCAELAKAATSLSTVSGRALVANALLWSVVRAERVLLHRRLRARLLTPYYATNVDAGLLVLACVKGRERRRAAYTRLPSRVLTHAFGAFERLHYDLRRDRFACALVVLSSPKGAYGTESERAFVGAVWRDRAAPADAGRAALAFSCRHCVWRPEWGADAYARAVDFARAERWSYSAADLAAVVMHGP